MGFIGIISAVLVIIGILLIRQISSVVPSLVACMLRWKECVNLESSTKISRDRDIVSLYLMLPFCLIMTAYRLFPADFLSGMSDFPYFACIAGIFLVFAILRQICFRLIRHPKSSEKIFKYAHKVFISFFCIMALIVLMAVGICSFSGASEDITRMVSYYCMLFVYVVFLFRLFQIFRNSCSFLSAILYLCVLEILPGGILVLSAMIF